MDICFLDFEYRPYAGGQDIVCACSMDYAKRETRSFWLCDRNTSYKDKAEFFTFISELHKKGYIFCAYAAGAEIDSLLQIEEDLGPGYESDIKVKDLRFICLRLATLPFVYSGKDYADFWVGDEITTFNTVQGKKKQVGKKVS